MTTAEWVSRSVSRGWWTCPSGPHPQVQSPKRWKEWAPPESWRCICIPCTIRLFMLVSPASQGKSPPTHSFWCLSSLSLPFLCRGSDQCSLEKQRFSQSWPQASNLDPSSTSLAIHGKWCCLVGTTILCELSSPCWALNFPADTLAPSSLLWVGSWPLSRRAWLGFRLLRWLHWAFALPFNEGRS